MSSWSRLARTAFSYASSNTVKQGIVDGQGTRLASKQISRQWRGYASGGHHGDGVTHGGLTLHKPAGWHVATGKGLAAVMWFWIMYRFYHDHDTFLYGHAQHHEHTLHEQHEEHEKH